MFEYRAVLLIAVVYRTSLYCVQEVVNKFFQRLKYYCLRETKDWKVSHVTLISSLLCADVGVAFVRAVLLGDA
jgi:hypothetical protein